MLQRWGKFTQTILQSRSDFGKLIVSRKSRNHLKSMHAEAELLLENDRFESIGEWYCMGEIVKKSNRTALYFYTKSWDDCLVKRDMYTANCYSIACFF